MDVPCVAPLTGLAWHSNDPASLKRGDETHLVMGWEREDLPDGKENGQRNYSTPTVCRQPFVLLAWMATRVYGVQGSMTDEQMQQ